MRHKIHRPNAFGKISFEVWQPNQRERLAGIIEQTYIGSQDLPLLDQLRDTSDVIDGYLATGTRPTRLVADHSTGWSVILVACYSPIIPSRIKPN